MEGLRHSSFKLIKPSSEHSDFFFVFLFSSSSCNAKEALDGLPLRFLTSFSCDSCAFACSLAFVCFCVCFSQGLVFLGLLLFFLGSTCTSTICSSCSSSSSISFCRISILRFCFLLLTVRKSLGITLNPDSQTLSLKHAATKCLHTNLL